MSKHPKGCLIPIGGAEDKGTDLEAGRLLRDTHQFFEIGILKCVLEQIPKGEKPVIEVLTTAAGEPEETFDNYKEGFRKLDCQKVGHLNIRSRTDADSDAMMKRLDACNCILISGGDQLRLSSTFGGTRFLDRLRERYHTEPFVIAGTSAGAMVMSNPMIYEGRADRANLKGEVKIISGFGLVDDVIIDTHVDKRGRFSRLAQSVAAQPGALGVGLGEDTGLIIRNGSIMQAIGSSSIILIDGRQIVCTNIAEIEEGSPITVQNLAVHILAAGDRYDSGKRTFLPRVSVEAMVSALN